MLMVMLGSARNVGFVMKPDIYMYIKTHILDTYNKKEGFVEAA